MTSLKQQLRSYGAYHRDPRNKLTHFLGVPLVTFSLFLALGWFRFVHAPGLPLTGAVVFYQRSDTGLKTRGKPRCRQRLVLKPIPWVEPPKRLRARL
jgi:hypothetical protein